MTMRSFEKLIAPLLPRAFFDQYWERRFWHAARRAPGLYDEILSLAGLEDYFHSRQIAAAFVNVVRNGESVPLSQWTRSTDSPVDEHVRLAEPDKLLALFGGGATIVLNRIHGSISSVTNFCRSLSEELGVHARANLYMTPPHSQGYAAHYDLQDLLILQLHGRKRWTLYDAPVPLPTRGEKVCAAAIAAAKPQLELELAAGDLLYLPRGMVHVAATGDSSSIHVSLGLQARCWYELAEDLMEELRGDPRFRRALPHRFSNPAEVEADLRLFRERVQALAASMDFGAGLHAQPKEARSEARADEVRLGALLRAEQIRLDSLLCRRSEVDFNLEAAERSTVVCVGDHRIHVPVYLLPALTPFLQFHPFRVDEIEGLLSAKQKIEFASQFVRSGMWELSSRASVSAQERGSFV